MNESIEVHRGIRDEVHGYFEDGVEPRVIIKAIALAFSSRAQELAEEDEGNCDSDVLESCAQLLLGELK